MAGTEPTSVERVSEWVRGAIRAGALAPGQRLVELELMRQLGVARNSVREAVQLLAGQGLLVIERNRGPMVRALGRQEVAELFEIRERLEGLAARRAASHAGAGLARLAALHTHMQEIVESVDVARYAAANTDFHDQIMAMAASLRLQEMAGRLSLSVFRLQFRAQLTAEALRASFADHTRILQAIQAADPDAAEAAMAAHIAASAGRVQHLPESLFRAEI